MGFTFSKHTVDVEIEGIIYTINLGSADTLDQVEAWGNKLEKLDYASLTEGRIKLLTQDVMNYLRALLGKEQFEEITKQRKLDMIDGLELFAYLWSEIEKSRVDMDFAATLKKYMPEIDLSPMAEEH